MKKLLTIIFFTFSFTFSLYAQNYENLVVKIKDSFSKDEAIYVEPINSDRILVMNYLSKSLTTSGFTVVTERSKAMIALTIRYKHREDNGACGHRTLKEFDGEITDIQSSADVLATFSFSQNEVESYCPAGMMDALAARIKTEMEKGKKGKK